MARHLNTICRMITCRSMTSGVSSFAMYQVFCYSSGSLSSSSWRVPRSDSRWPGAAREPGINRLREVKRTSGKTHPVGLSTMIYAYSIANSIGFQRNIGRYSYRNLRSDVK
jgi:hypothetical protein